MPDKTLEQNCIAGINPQHPKDVLDGVIEAGMKIKSWSMNYRDDKLTIVFHPTPHCGKGCNIESHECFECDACKYCECEC